MTRIVITASSEELAAMMERLKPERARMALSVAVNDTTRQTKRKARPVIAKASSIPAGTVERGLRIYPMSNPGTLLAVINATGRPIALHAFKHRQTKKGVRATVWGKSQFYPGMFRVGSIGGSLFTNTRRMNKKSGRLNAIEKAYGAGIAQVTAQEAVSNVIVRYGRQQLYTNARRQLDRYLAGAGGRGR